jgi:hypothetical protein
MKKILIGMGMLGLSACGLGDRTADVGFVLKLEGDAAAQSAPFSPASASNGSPLLLDTATVNVAEIAFKTSPGMCEGGHVGPDGERGPHARPMGNDVEDGEEVDTTGDSVHGECRADGFVVVEGPFRIDLLTGESTPSLASIEVTVGTYRWIDLRLAPVADEGDDMNGLTLVADGTYAGDGTTPVHIAMVIGEPPMRIQPADGITVDEEGGVDIVVALQERDWFAGVDADLEVCVQAPNAPLIDGVLQITGQTNTACDKVNGTLRQNFIGAGSKASVGMERR